MSYRSIVEQHHSLSEKRRIYIFINILITCIASSMLATALTTALPAIVNDLKIDVNTGQWLTSGYSLAMAVMMPLTAFLITRFSTRKLYLSAITIFIIGLVICVIAPNFEVMMAGRVLQACGNGILTSMAQVILLTIFPLHKRGTIMGWYGLSIGAAPVIAPTIAGMLVDSSGWQMIFYIAIIIMLISLIFALAIFEDVLDTHFSNFDLYSFFLSILAFGGITLSVGNILTYGISNPTVYVPLIIGGIGIVLFIYRQLNLDQPFLELRIVQHKEFLLSLIGSMLLYLVMMGSAIIMPLYVQHIMRLSATTSGLITLPGSLAMTIISPFAGKIYDKIGIKKLFISGALFILISNIGMALITMNTSILIPTLFGIIRSLGIGCLLMPLITWGMSRVDGDLTAHGTAILTSLRTIAGALGSAIFVSIMSAVAISSLSTYGENAQIHGLNVSFWVMSCFSLLLLLIPLIFIRSKKDKSISRK